MMGAMTRLFVAAWPSAAVKAALGDLPAGDERGVRRVSPANWHVTLRFVGEADIDELRWLLADVRLPRATATLGPVIEPLGRRQVVVPVDGVDELAHAVHRATIVVGARSTRPFVGHLTIARLRPRARTSLIGVPISTSFVVDEIALVASDLAADVPTYTTVATFPTT